MIGALMTNCSRAVIPAGLRPLVAGLPLVISAALFAGSVKTATVSDVQTFCGTQNVRIAFCLADSGLYYVDYSEVATGTPPVHKMANTGNARLPMLSPNGQWVAYATGVNDDQALMNQGGGAWLRQVAQSAQPVRVDTPAYVPRFAQKGIDTPTIVYATCAYDANNQSWRSCGSVLKKRFVSGSFLTAETVHAAGSYLAGLSYDERYLATAEHDSYGYILDMQNGSDLPHPTPFLRLNSGDTLPNQVCNGSVSTSRVFTNAMLLLTVAGANTPYGSWGFHEMIFVCNNHGEVQRYYRLPPDIHFDTSGVGHGEINGAEWNSTEWSNHPYFAVAIVNLKRLWTVPGIPPFDQVTKGECVYIVDLKNDLSLRVLQITDTSQTGRDAFAWPALHVDVPRGFQEDTAWLSTPVTRPPVHADSHGAVLRVERGEIVSSSLIGSAAVFSAYGRLLKRLSVDNRHSAPLPVMRQPGVYLIRAETAAGDYSVRWIVRGH